MRDLGTLQKSGWNVGEVFWPCCYSGGVAAGIWKGVARRHCDGGYEGLTCIFCPQMGTWVPFTRKDVERGKEGFEESGLMQTRYGGLYVRLKKASTAIRRFLILLPRPTQLCSIRVAKLRCVG